jgi:hypothetical protein
MDFLGYVITPKFSCIKRRKLYRQIDKGAAKFDSNLDILSLFRLQDRVSVIERLLLNDTVMSLLDHQAEN